MQNKDAESYFQPSWWLKNPHLQTIWAGLTRCRPSLKYTTEKLSLPDNDFLNIVYTEDNGGPIALVLHGLQGSIRSRYALGMLKALHNQGFFAILMHFRSCMGEVNNQPRLYHSGETSDCHYVIQHLLTHWPDRKMTAIGFSLGGNVLLKLLGEVDTKLDAAAAVSIPMRLDYCADRINQGFSKLYQWNLVRSMKIIARKKASLGHLQGLDTEKIFQSKTFWDIDNYLTAPLHGFKNANDYYDKCSSRQFLKNIKIPTLIIQAKDDPFTSEAVIPSANELSEYVQLEVTQHGGHVGFVEGNWPWQTNYWLEEKIPLFLKQHLS